MNSLLGNRFILLKIIGPKNVLALLPIKIIFGFLSTYSIAYFSTMIISQINYQCVLISVYWLFGIFSKYSRWIVWLHMFDSHNQEQLFNRIHDNNLKCLPIEKSEKQSEWLSILLLYWSYEKKGVYAQSWIQPHSILDSSL